MPHRRWGSAVRIGILASSFLGLASCGFGDLFRTAGPRAVTIDYTGSTTIFLGSPAPFSLTVTANGVPVANPQLILASSDTSIFVINATRDSLIPVSFGSGTFTAQLLDAAFTDSMPTVAVHIRVRN